MNDISRRNTFSNNIFDLLLLSRNDNNSYFYKNYFPLDIFKIIYNDIWNYELELLKIVEHNGCDIQFIRNPSEQVQLAAVRQWGYAIEFIKNPTINIQLEAVKENGYAIQFIKNPSEQIQLEAVKQTGYAIQFIKNPSKQIQLEAVQQTYYAIHYIINPSEKVQLEAEKSYNALIGSLNGNYKKSSRKSSISC